MTPSAAQRLRFGILAARHEGERGRLTEDQVDYLEGCESVGWRVKYSREAYDAEWENILSRMLPKKESPNAGL